MSIKNKHAKGSRNDRNVKNYMQIYIATKIVTSAEEVNTNKINAHVDRILPEFSNIHCL